MPNWYMLPATKQMYKTYVEECKKKGIQPAKFKKWFKEMKTSMK